jgi:hypothetical protein
MTDLRNALQACDLLLYKTPQIVLDNLVTSSVDWTVDHIIEEVSEETFCRKLNPANVPYQYHHQAQWFSETEVFSMQPPRANWFTQTDIDNDVEDKVISVYRMNPEFCGRELQPLDILTMKKAAQAIIDSKQPYSIGQLLNMLCNTIGGFPDYDKVQIFTWTDKRLVCSVAVHAILYNWINSRKEAGEVMPYPYAILNPEAWDKKFIENFKSPWPLHAIFPAHPAVSKTHFSGEYSFIGDFTQGKQIA